jgi:hypothetical protein
MSDKDLEESSHSVLYIDYCHGKTKLRGLSPRANYTNRATAAYSRS